MNLAECRADDFWANTMEDTLMLILERGIEWRNTAMRQFLIPSIIRYAYYKEYGLEDVELHITLTSHSTVVSVRGLPSK